MLIYNCASNFKFRFYRFWYYIFVILWK